jgi:divalent metal cation (Fe/Co/Zn/Cd) transporter
MELNPISATQKKRLYKLAFGLALFTIIYNIVEGLISIYFGYEDEILVLFGFGTDSFIEVISGIGIAHMVLRIQSNPNSNRDRFEKTALQITGFSFYTLVIGMVVSAIYNIWKGNKPETTFWGIIIAIASIIIMWILIIEKKKVGKQLDSEAILADAECTKVCIYMSIVLLISSGIYELTNIAYIDSIGTLGLAYFAFNEGKECFEKAKHNKYCSCKNN